MSSVILNKYFIIDKVKPREYTTAMNEIERIRLELKMTGDELGALLGVTKSAIYNYEASRRTPADGVAYRLLQFARKQGVVTSMEKIKGF